MKPDLTNRRNQAITLFELLVVLAVIVVLAAMLLPAISVSKTGHGSNRLGCINNLKQINLAYRVWAGDNNDKYPMEISVTNGGTMELAAAGNVMATCLVMSNELSTPKVLYCPVDLERNPARDFGPSFTATNISYFIGLDANESNPQRPLSGDDHLQVSGLPVRPGLATLSTNQDVAWTSARHAAQKEHFWSPPPHRNGGNIGLADGSAQPTDKAGLQQTFQQTGLSTNRLAIP